MSDATLAIKMQSVIKKKKHNVFIKIANVVYFFFSIL